MDGLILSNKNYSNDIFDQDKKTSASKPSMVHIRTQQRTGRKCLTLVSGLATDLDVHKILKCMRKLFNTNGTILHDENNAEVIQLQGDRRHEVAEFLVKYCVVASKDEVHIHGF